MAETSYDVTITVKEHGDNKPVTTVKFEDCSVGNLLKRPDIQGVLLTHIELGKENGGKGADSFEVTL